MRKILTILFVLAWLIHIKPDIWKRDDTLVPVLKASEIRESKNWLVVTTAFGGLTYFVPYSSIAYIERIAD